MTDKEKQELSTAIFGILSEYPGLPKRSAKTITRMVVVEVRKKTRKPSAPRLTIEDNFTYQREVKLVFQREHYTSGLEREKLESYLESRPKEYPAFEHWDIEECSIPNHPAIMFRCSAPASKPRSTSTSQTPKKAKPKKNISDQLAELSPAEQANLLAKLQKMVKS